MYIATLVEAYSWHMEGSGLALIIGDCIHLFFLSSAPPVRSLAIVVDIDVNAFITQNSNLDVHHINNMCIF